MGSLIAFCRSTKPGNRYAKQMLATAIVGASNAEQREQSLPAVDLIRDEQLTAACDNI